MASVLFLAASVLLLSGICGGQGPSRRRSPVKCTSPFRDPTGLCTHDSRRNAFLGAASTPYFSYFVRQGSSMPRGASLPSARQISNLLFAQSQRRLDERGLNELAAYFTQFLLHDISSTPTNSDEPLDIPIPEGDTVGGFSTAIPFFRSQRAPASRRDLAEFPINAQTSAVDLSVIYGASKIRTNAVRTGIMGMMKTSSGDLLSLGSPRLANLPKPGPKYFLSGDERANENPVLTSLHTLFMREHNRIAKELAGMFPRFSDEILFQQAKLINGAQFQKIVFDEWYPAMTNRRLSRYRGFQKRVDPTVSVSFSTAALQLFSSMVGNQITRLGKMNIAMPPLTARAMFFPTTDLLERDNLEPYLRGALKTNAEKVDTMIQDVWRNLLFAGRSRAENLVDIAAETIQRGRDHALPSINALRVRFGMPKVRAFSMLTTDPKVQRALRSAYGSPSNVEAFSGLLAEDHEPDFSLGSTLLNIWERELRRLRDGDRFYFRSDSAFQPEIRNVPTVKMLLSNEDTFRRIVLVNTEITEGELPTKMFFTA